MPFLRVYRRQADIPIRYLYGDRSWQGEAANAVRVGQCQPETCASGMTGLIERPYKPSGFDGLESC